VGKRSWIRFQRVSIWPDEYVRIGRGVRFSNILFLIGWQTCIYEGTPRGGNQPLVGYPCESDARVTDIGGTGGQPKLLNDPVIVESYEGRSNVDFLHFDAVLPLPLAQQIRSFLGRRLARQRSRIHLEL